MFLGRTALLDISNGTGKEIQEEFIMNKTELVAAIAEQAEISKKDAEKALKAFTDVVAEELKKGIFTEYEYYLSLTPKEQRFAGRQMRAKPMEYSLVVGAVSDAYSKIGQKDKGYDYLVKSVEPIDKKFNAFIKDLKTMGKEKAYNEAENVQQITPFYTYLFDIMNPYDSTYAKEKENQITTAIIKATQ